MTSKYSAEIMRQNYSDFNTINIFKLGILLYLSENGFIVKNRLIKEVAVFIYRFAIDNYDLLAINSSNVILKNLIKYSPVDLVSFTIEAIKEWIKDGTGILNLKNDYIYTIMDNLSDNDLLTLNTVASAVEYKLIRRKLNYNSSIENDFNFAELKSKYNKWELFDFINTTRFRLRALENHKYCFCCNDLDVEKLKVAPIEYLTDNNDEVIYTSHNSLVLCNSHYKLYINDYFHFDNNGSINIDKQNAELDVRMRIPLKILTKDKKMLLKANNDKIR